MVPEDFAAGGGNLALLRRAGLLRLLGVGGSWLRFEDVLAGAGQTHIFASDAFDGGGIGLQVFHVVLQGLILFVELVDIFLDFAGFYLRAMHGQNAVGSEYVLQKQQGEACHQKPIHIAAEKAAELLGEGLARILRGDTGGPRCCTRFRSAGFCEPLLHFVIQARASSANFSAAAGFAASV